MEHGGHRDRLRQRFLNEGLDSFGDERVLEMLLFNAIPRKDTYPIAKELIRQFGSLVEVMEASPAALAEVPGVGESTAAYIHFIMATYRYYSIKRYSQRRVLDTVEKCAEYLQPRFLGLQEEVVCALSLDARCGVTGCKILGEGSVNSANVPIRKIVEFALNHNATTLVLAHNHPAGIALPSSQDVESTKRVAAALEGIGVTLADHLIITPGDYTSMAESGLLRGIWI